MSYHTSQGAAKVGRMVSTQTTAIPSSSSLRCVQQCFSNFDRIGFSQLVSSVAPHVAVCFNSPHHLHDAFSHTSA